MRLIISILFLALSNSYFSQCTLEIESLVATPVSCNGLSDGEVTVNVVGGNGAISFSSGGGGTVISPNQEFNTPNSLSTASGNGPTNQWWSPSTCNGGPYIYSSTLGCPAGAAVYNGVFSGFTGCFLRSPQLNMNGVDNVNVSFDLSHSFNSSRTNDRIRIYCWVNNGYMSVPANYTINGTSGQFLNFNQVRNCEKINVSVNLSGIPTNSRSDFFFYIETNCQYNNCSSYQAIVDNIVISEAAPSQASNVFTGLPSGDFTVTVSDASGCSVTQTIFVPQPEPLSLTASSTPTSTINGNDGTATVAIEGGNDNPQISWNTTPVQTTATATELTAGNYTVNVIDSKGCTAETLVTVGEPSCDNFNITSIESSNLTCFNSNDGSIEIIAESPNGNVTYSLNNQTQQSSGMYNNLMAGTYTLEIYDDAGCIISPSSSIEITQPVEVVPVINLFDNFLVVGGFVSYQWYLNGELLLNETDSVHYFSANGSYYVSATDENGCTGISNTIVVTATSIQKKVQATFEVFPNPFFDYIFIQNKTANTFGLYRIFSITGQLVTSGVIHDSNMKINTSELKSGIYNLNIWLNEKTENFRVVKY